MPTSNIYDRIWHLSLCETKSYYVHLVKQQRHHDAMNKRKKKTFSSNCLNSHFVDSMLKAVQRYSQSHFYFLASYFLFCFHVVVFYFFFKRTRINRVPRNGMKSMNFWFSVNFKNVLKSKVNSCFMDWIMFIPGKKEIHFLFREMSRKVCVWNIKMIWHND